MKIYIVSYSVADECNEEMYLSDPMPFTSVKDVAKAVEGFVNDELMEYPEDENYKMDDDDSSSKDEVLDREIRIMSSRRTFILKVKTI